MCKRMKQPQVQQDTEQKRENEHGQCSHRTPLDRELEGMPQWAEAEQKRHSTVSLYRLASFCYGGQDR